MSAETISVRVDIVPPELGARIREVLRSGQPFKIELHGKDGAVLAGDVTERFKSPNRRPPVDKTRRSGRQSPR